MNLAFKKQMPAVIDHRKAFKRLVRLALPIWGAQLAQIGISTSNIIMAGHHSTVDLAAVSLGASIWLPLVFFMTGTLIGLTPIIAQLLGGNKIEQIALNVQHTLWIALVLGIFVAFLLIVFPPYIYRFMSAPPLVAQFSHDYLKVIACGMPASALYLALRAYSDGFNHTRPAFWFNLLGFVINIPVGYCFIYGKLGFPALGSLGCGIAGATAMWCSFLAMLFYVSYSRIYLRVKLWHHIYRPRWSTIFAILKIGLPIGVAIFSEVTMFAVVALFIASYGTITVAAHEVATNFSSILYTMPLAAGMALTIQVGTAIGAGNEWQAASLAWHGLKLSLVVAFISAMVVLVFAPIVSRIYSNNPDVIRLAIKLMYIMIFFLFSDALQTGIAGALRGYKDTRVVMACMLTAYWLIGLPVGYILSHGITNIFKGLQVYGFWFGLIAGLTASAMLLSLRLLFLSRKRIRQLAL